MKIINVTGPIPLPCTTPLNRLVTEDKETPILEWNEIICSEEVEMHGSIDVVQAVVGHSWLDFLTVNRCLQRINTIYTEDCNSRKQYISCCIGCVILATFYETPCK